MHVIYLILKQIILINLDYQSYIYYVYTKFKLECNIRYKNVA